MPEKKEVDVLERIDEGVDIEKVMKEREFEPEHWITIEIMGKRYKVPAGLTILKAIEYAGYRFIRGCGCRAGFCGACATVYRKRDDFRIYTALACQTTAEDGMILTQLPFTPAPRANYNIEEVKPEENVLLRYYPEIAKCVACNTCTRSCPQELDVMDYIQAALRGDIKKVAELSFDCVQCGLCTARCPSEIRHYHLAQMARRIYGKYMSPTPKHLENRIMQIESGLYDKAFERIMSLSEEELKKLYYSRRKEVEEDPRESPFLEED